ncbi:MAG: hypothetical protein WEG56_13375 [Chloroflexota bacterium]
MRIVRSSLAAALLAISALALGATAVLAECPPGPDDTKLNVRYAFTATVVEASEAVGPAVPDNAPFDWHLELATVQVYRGDVPDALTFDGWSAGCHGIRGDQLQSGDRLFILSEHLYTTFLPRDPLWGDFLMWKGEDGRWAYYADALGENTEDIWITQAMRDASTTSAILSLAHLNPPETATDDAPTRGASWLALLAAFVASGLVVDRRLRRSNPRPTA